MPPFLSFDSSLIPLTQLEEEVLGERDRLDFFFASFYLLFLISSSESVSPFFAFFESLSSLHTLTFSSFSSFFLRLCSFAAILRYSLF